MQLRIIIKVWNTKAFSPTGAHIQDANGCNCYDISGKDRHQGKPDHFGYRFPVKNPPRLNPVEVTQSHKL